MRARANCGLDRCGLGPLLARKMRAGVGQKNAGWCGLTCGLLRGKFRDKIKLAKNTSVFLSSRVLSFRVHHPYQGPLTHLCDLEAGYGGVWAPNFGGAAPGFETRTSCWRVRSVTITLRGPPLYLVFIAIFFKSLKFWSVFFFLLQKIFKVLGFAGWTADSRARAQPASIPSFLVKQK